MLYTIINRWNGETIATQEADSLKEAVQNMVASFADLRSADLSSANLRSANRIIGPQRSDGYLFTFCIDTQRVLAGCRTMSIADYIEHCDTYADSAKKTETLAILKCLELLVAARGAK